MARFFNRLKAATTLSKNGNIFLTSEGCIERVDSLGGDRYLYHGLNGTVDSFSSLTDVMNFLGL